MENSRFCPPERLEPTGYQGLNALKRRPLFRRLESRR
jgi:hypothetical protein